MQRRLHRLGPVHPGTAAGRSAHSLPCHTDLQVCLRKGRHRVPSGTHAWEQFRCNEAQPAGAAQRGTSPLGVAVPAQLR